MSFKKLPNFLFVFIFTSLLISCMGKNNSDNNIIIWTYDSFNSEWGPAPKVSESFKKKTGITITWVNHGDANEVLSRLIFEGKDADADIILGLDQNMVKRVLDSGLFEPYFPKSAGNIADFLILDSEFHLIPMDYSYFSIIYDSEKIFNPPLKLEDLTSPQYKENLILIDPRTSSPGQGFFAWVKDFYGSQWQSYWQRLEPSILTITENWSTAYGLFTSGEAPLVLSYTTSPGYHLEYENSERYRAAIFIDGHPIQIEGAGLLETSKNKDNAKKFLDFMLTPDFQSIIPLTNWMYPVIDIPLPDCFRINPKSSIALRPPPVTESDLNEWAAFMSAFSR